MSFSEIATPYEANDWHKGFEIMEGKLSESTAKGECICYFSQRLCLRHGDEMTSIKRDISIKLALCDFRDIELIAAAGVMDKVASKTIASFLRSDIAPPSRVRQFLADAIDGKNEHWRIEWKAMKSGGQGQASATMRSFIGTEPPRERQVRPCAL